MKLLVHLLMTLSMAIVFGSVVWWTMPPPIQIGGLTYNRATKEARLERFSLDGEDVFARWQFHCHWNLPDGGIRQVDSASEGMDIVEGGTTAVFFIPPEDLRLCLERPHSAARFTYWPYAHGIVPLRPVRIDAPHRNFIRGPGQ